MKNASSPSRLALWLLDRFGGRGDDYGAAGDFEEYYRALAAESGIRRARREIWKQVLAAFPGHIKNSLIWSAAMIKNYVRIALRNLSKYKGYSFINIGGLALGIACALFILLWVQDELSFDRFHANAKLLFRLDVERERPEVEGRIRLSSTPHPLAPALKADLPEIKDATRLDYLEPLLVRCEEKAFFESGVRAVDPQFLQMFTFPLVKGDPATALGQPGSTVLTEEMARKYCGDSDPIGKTVTINGTYAFMITGVLKNIPPNSSLAFDMLVPFEFVKTIDQYDDSMMHFNTLTFVQLFAQGDVAAASEKITRLVWDRNLAGIQADPARAKSFENNPEQQRRLKSQMFILTPLVDINLFGARRAIRDVRTYSTLALFVLLIACLNFMNLATARSSNRAKEIGLRKVVGAQRRSILGQFFGESVLNAFLAGTVAFVLIILFFPAFTAFSGKALKMSVLLGEKFILGFLTTTLFTGLVAGSYPAIFLSSFQPVRVLKGRLGGGPKSALFRKTLVIIQFGLSIFLLVCTAAVVRQIEYMRNKDLGYDKEPLITLPLRDQAPSSYGVFKEQLLQNPRILGVSGIRQPPTSITAAGVIPDWDGKDPAQKFPIFFASVDFEYTETLKIEMAAGRPFSRTVASDLRQAFLVNEEVPKLMGLDAASAVGRRFSYWGYEGTIVGVMKNFHYQSVRNIIEPLAVVVDPKKFRFVVVRLKAGEIPASLEVVKETWHRVFPHYPIEYGFFDEDFDQMYRNEERMGTILKPFSALAVMIACLGLFGLASYTAEQRAKEIGVRKVLGASSPGIALSFSMDFAKWVLMSNILAWPAAYFLMKKWLQNFAYNTGISWWLFVAAGAGALAIAVLTVGFQAFRASQTDPVRTLKYE